MPSVSYFTGSCGVQILSGIRSGGPEAAVQAVVSALMDVDPTTWGQPQGDHSSSRQRPFVVFTGVVERGSRDRWHGHAYKDDPDYCNILADYIETNGLGVVTRSGSAESWTTNILAVFVWMVNYDGLRKWVEERQKEAAKAA